MLYAIISEDTKDSLEKRVAARPSHISRLQNLQDEGRLILAGPHPAIDTDNLQAAQLWANSDPYNDAGVYAKVIVKPFKKVFPQ